MMGFCSFSMSYYVLKKYYDDNKNLKFSQKYLLMVIYFYIILTTLIEIGNFLYSINDIPIVRSQIIWIKQQQLKN